MNGLLLTLALAVAPGDTLARYLVTPSAVEVGEPFTLVLELEHDVDANVFELAGAELLLDETWVVLGDVHTAPLVLDDGRRTTRRSWTVVSLEPGERSLLEQLPALPGVQSVDASGASIQVASVLAPDENARRPVHGFPDGFGSGTPPAEPSPWRALALAAAVLFWSAFLVLLWRRRRTRTRAAPVPAPRERLEELLRQPVEGPAAVRARHFELTALVRAAADAEAGRQRAGMTDDEWLAALRAERGAPGPVEELLERAASVKYAGDVPTSWALDEVHECARRALEALAPAPNGAAVGGAS